MYNVFSCKKQIKYMDQALNLERLLCKSKLMLVEENLDVNSCGRNYLCYPYLLKTSSYLFKKSK